MPTVYPSPSQKSSQSAPGWLSPLWPYLKPLLTAGVGAALAYLERWFHGEAPAFIQGLF